MEREEEYKRKCRQVKDYYLEEICEHEDAGCLGDAENARKWRRLELEELPVQLRRVLDDLWSDGNGVECYLVEWDGRYCVQLSAMYDGSYAADLGMGYPELVELARGRAEELGAERPDLHVVFAEDVDQWKANDPFTEIWVVMPWNVDADAFHEVADWLDSRCRFNE